MFQGLILPSTKRISHNWLPTEFPLLNPLPFPLNCPKRIVSPLQGWNLSKRLIFLLSCHPFGIRLSSNFGLLFPQSTSFPTELQLNPHWISSPQSTSFPIELQSNSHRIPFPQSTSFPTELQLNFPFPKSKSFPTELQSNSYRTPSPQSNYKKSDLSISTKAASFGG